MHRSQLRWQCRRGMRELDELLTAYLEHRYDAAGADEKAAFCRLLSLADPVLISYLMQRETPPPEFALVIQQLLVRTQD